MQQKNKPTQPMSTQSHVQTFWTELVLALVSGFPGSIASISVRRKKPEELDEDSTK
jgi:hypothetical protein